MSDERKQYRQVARRYAEGEMLARKQELADANQTVERLRAALMAIDEVIANALDAEDFGEAIRRIRAIVGNATSS